MKISQLFRIALCGAIFLGGMQGIALSAGNTTNDSFNKAKKMLEREVYFDHRITIYCGAEFDEKKKVVLPYCLKDLKRRSIKSVRLGLNGNMLFPLKTLVEPLRSGETAIPNVSTIRDRVLREDDVPKR